LIKPQTLTVNGATRSVLEVALKTKDIPIVLGLSRVTGITHSSEAGFSSHNKNDESLGGAFIWRTPDWDVVD
jgi:hypothetical protein